MKKIWWKEAVIYQIYPRSFYDSNGDGIGDLQGIIQKLDYLSDLGVDVLWLSPIFASPNLDNGYDISDYRMIMPEFGTMADFEELLAQAHHRGLKVILDLVVNHSSDQHQWFQESRAASDNPYSDYYIWKDEIPNDWQSFFGGPAWTYDDQRQAYYLHLFTSHQPDLNWEHPALRAEIYDMMNFWYDKGIDGFRMDVIPLISKDQSYPDAVSDNFDQVIFHNYANGPRLHEYLQEMHQQSSGRYDVMTVGECIGVTDQNCMMYVDERRKELNMLYHFEHMSLDTENGEKYSRTSYHLSDFKRIFQKWDEALGAQGWYNVFLDNHDFPRMVSRFGDGGAYRLQSAKLLATMLLTLRGTPCIYQGSEIGMTNVSLSQIEEADDIWAHNYYHEQLAKGDAPAGIMARINACGRDNARTPVQWSAEHHAGFTTASAPWLKVNPNYTEINVAQAEADEQSILLFYKRLLALRKAYPTLIYGAFTQRMPEHESLFIYERHDDAGHFLVLLNFSADEVEHVQDISVEAELIMHNYDSPGAASFLRAWEARVYNYSVKFEIKQ